MAERGTGLGWLIGGILVVGLALVLILRHFDSRNPSQSSGSPVAPVQTNRAPAPVRAPPPARDPVADAAQNYISRHFLKCGGNDFYSTQNAWNRHYQFKDLQWNWSPLPLSSTDSLNGIDWKGTLHIRCQNYRDTEYSSNWANWQSCDGTGITAFGSFKPDVGMTSRKGKWTYGVTQTMGSLAEAGNSQIIEALAPANKTCRFYQAVASAD